MFTTDQKIQIISIVASLLFSLISVTIAIIAIRQTAKAAKQSAQSEFLARRPYITIYSDSMSAQGLSMDKMLVIRNFGQTPAVIDHIDFSGELDKGNARRRFSSLEHFTMAPGMRVQADVDSKLKTVVNCSVNYHDLQNHQFFDTFTINFDFMTTVMMSEHNSSKYSIDANGVINAIHRLAREVHR